MSHQTCLVPDAHDVCSTRRLYSRVYVVFVLFIRTFLWRALWISWRGEKFVFRETLIVASLATYLFLFLGPTFSKPVYFSRLASTSFDCSLALPTFIFNLIHISVFRSLHTIINLAKMSGGVYGGGK